MTPAQAGWSLIGEDAPAPCPGSGQLLIMPAVIGAAYPCPSCGEYVRTVGTTDAAALAEHLPPAGEAPTISLGL